MTNKEHSQAADTYRNPLGHAPIGRLMLQFSIPCIITLVVSSLYNIVDQIFIGQSVGYLGNAATNVIFPLTVFAMAISLMLGDGGAVFMNLNLGQGNKKEASKAAGNVVVTSLLSGIVLSIVCLIFLEPICRLLGASNDSLSFALDYGYIIVIGFVFTNFSNSVSALIRADGSPHYSMAVMISGAITNTILDPIFIFGFGWGVKGAAWATLIGQLVSAVLCASYFTKFKHIDFVFSSLKIHLKTIGRICALGISSFITQAAVFIVISTSNNALAFYGAQSVYGADIPLAALGITMKVNQIILGVCIGIAVGCAPIISFNYGALQIKRVKTTIVRCIAASVLIMAFATICYEFFPQYIVLIFGSGSVLYEQFSIKTFRIFLCLSVLNGFQTCSAILFQAIGAPVKSMVISISRQVLFFIPAMFIMSSFMGVEGILWAGPIGDILAFLLALPLVLFQFRKFKKSEKMLKNCIEQARADENCIGNSNFEDEALIDFDMSRLEFERAQFIKCKFERCDFSGSSFYHVGFVNCDFSNCIFTETFWKQSHITDCKGAGGNFTQSHLKESSITNSLLNYSNFSNSVWDDCVINNCFFKESFFTESKIKKLKLKGINLSGANFFKTPLKGINLSDCLIDGIIVSDNLNELRGVKINAAQAVSIVQILGIEIIRQ